MPIKVERNLAVRLLGEQFETIESICSDFDEEIWMRPTCLPGWTVKDNVSHMVGTESMLAGRPSPEIVVGERAHVLNPIGEANEIWIESMRSLSGAEVLDRFREITAERIAALEAMTQDDFDAPSWTPAGPNETYGRFMRIRHYDCFMHTLDITEAAGIPDVTPAEHLMFALEEPVAGLGYIVGKKAALPKGVTIRIELTGPAGGELLVNNAERAAVVESLDGPPTFTIRVDPVLFLRLTGGRVRAADLTDDRIEIDGDGDLARQLLDNIAFTI